MTRTILRSRLPDNASDAKFSMIVRDLLPSDERTWRRLYFNYASHYDPSRASMLTENAWSSFASGECLVLFKVCESNGQLIGFANGVLHDDIAYRGTACYLQDLYVDPASRRMRVATALLTWFRRALESEGWTQLHWSSSAQNESATALYNRFGTQSEIAVRHAVWAD